MQMEFLHEESGISGAAPSSAENMPTMIASALESIPEISDEKSAGAFKTISEAAETLDVPQHVLRFWEGHFKQIKPLKLRGGRRYYRPEDMETLSTIKHLLYKQGYTIKGAKKALSANLRPPAEPAAQKVVVNETQQSKLMAIRQELTGLRDALKPYVF